MANDTWISNFFDEIKDNISFLSNQIKAFHFQMFIGDNITGMVEQINDITSCPKYNAENVVINQIIDKIDQEEMFIKHMTRDILFVSEIHMDKANSCFASLTNFIRCTWFIPSIFDAELFCSFATFMSF